MSDFHARILFLVFFIAIMVIFGKIWLWATSYIPAHHELTFLGIMLAICFGLIIYGRGGSR